MKKDRIKMHYWKVSEVNDVGMHLPGTTQVFYDIILRRIERCEEKGNYRRAAILRQLLNEIQK